MTDFFNIYKKIAPAFMVMVWAVFIFVAGIIYFSKFIGLSDSELNILPYLYLFCLVSFCLPGIISLGYLKKSENKQNDKNRFRRQHVRKFNCDFNLEFFINKITNELKCVDISVEVNKISFFFPMMILDSKYPGMQGEIKHARRARLIHDNDKVTVYIEPIRKYELFDLTMSSYFHGDRLVEVMGWSMCEIKQGAGSV